MEANEELDLRGVEPPGHILKLLKRASELPPGASIRARLDNNPAQLYDLLQQRGFILEIQPSTGGGYTARVRDNRDARTASAR